MSSLSTSPPNRVNSPKKIETDSPKSMRHLHSIFRTDQKIACRTSPIGRNTFLDRLEIVDRTRLHSSMMRLYYSRRRPR